MKVFVLDITGRNAAQYNPSLCKALGKHLNGEGEVMLFSPTHEGVPMEYKWKRLLSIVPSSMMSSSSKVKRLLRAIETILNYFYFLIVCLFLRPTIIHFQWLPFVEFSGIEKFFLLLIKLSCSKSKIVLTVHNIYPHSFDDKQRKKYLERFLTLKKYIDGYIVHLQSTSPQLIEDFHIPQSQIFLAYHGLYEAKGYKEMRKKNGGKTRIILYGYQTQYKGADTLMEALKKLPLFYLDKTETLIIGKTDQDLYHKYEKQTSSLNTTWINRFVEEEELYCAIGNSDLIILPYRQITQSGVLLLALSYNKPILTSNLPSFRETLCGYPDDYFFEPDNSDSLAAIIKRFVDGEIDIKQMKDIIVELRKKYSWEETAKNTILAYNSIMNK